MPVAPRRSLALQPDDDGAAAALAVSRLTAGNPDRAAAWFRRAAAIRPFDATYLANLGIVLTMSGRPVAALRHLRRAMALAASQADAIVAFGATLRSAGHLTQAVAWLKRGTAQSPLQPSAHLNLANALQSASKLEQALISYRRAVALKPDTADALYNHGMTQQRRGHHDEALLRYGRALALNSRHARAQNNIGSSLLACGRVPSALKAFRKAIDLLPSYAEAYSNLLFALQYEESLDPAWLKREHVRWESALVRVDARPLPVAPEPDRALRIGFVSGDLGEHVVGRQLVSVVEVFDRQQLRCCFYSTLPRPDSIQSRLKASADVWRDVEAVSDPDLADLIRADGIDVLIDMSGHTAYNRLPVFLRRPAPIQATWLGYPGTTGLSTIDYRIADPWLAPTEREIDYTETVVRLPETYTCYLPITDAGDPGQVPGGNDGRVTFGCFNNPLKVTDRVIDVWARILRRLPASRLVLRYGSLNNAEMRSRLMTGFARRGIAPERLDIVGSVSASEVWDWYRRTDIALDPFPHSGATTTFESLWMGLPVISRLEAAFVGRQTYALLANLGLFDLVAETDDDYVERATAVALDLPRLVEFRQTSRGRLLASPICRPERLARHLERMLRGFWQKHVGRR